MLNQLIYGKIKASSGGSGDFSPDLSGFSPNDTGGVDSDLVPYELLHSKNGRLLYANGCGVTLWTWWDFYQSAEENDSESVEAYINGRTVCPSHTTGHIIDYYIEREKIYGGKACVVIYVNMSMGDSGYEYSNWNGGAACTHRIWGGGDDDGGTSGFYEADKDHKCEKAGTCGGGATFKVVIDTNAGTYKIS